MAEGPAVVPGMVDASGATTGLKRALRLRDLTAFYVATVLSVRWTAMAAAAGPGSLVVWVFAVLGFFLPLSASVMELSSRYPREGGLYVWTREAFGDLAGFITAWMYWMSNLPFFASVLYFGAGSLLFAGGARGHGLAASPVYFMGFAVLWLAIITGVNILGLNAGKWLSNICSVGSWLPIVILILLAMASAHRFGTATHFTTATLMPRLTLKDTIFWSTICFAFSGIETGSFMADEIERPRRTIPLALLAAGGVLTVGYFLGTLALLVALPAGQVSGVDGFMHGVAVLCGRFGLGWLVVVMAGLVALNTMGGAAGNLASTSRLPFVAGIDLYLPPVFGRIHPRFRTPYVALGVYGLAGMLVAILGQAGTTVRGAYDVLVSMAIITNFIPFLLLFAAMARAQNKAAGPAVQRVPGGRPAALALAAVGFVTTLIAIVLSVIPASEEPNKPLAVAKVLVSTAVLIGGGTLLFLIAERKRKTLLGQRLPAGSR
ncbi:MAG TPA: APC family permease [Acidobacteriaceae bacterium]